jgi:hypothetical protein
MFLQVGIGEASECVSQMIAARSQPAGRVHAVRRMNKNQNRPTIYQSGRFQLRNRVPPETIENRLRYLGGYSMEETRMKKALAVLATVATVGATAVTAPAEARGLGPGLAFGLAAGALAAGAVGAYGPYGYGPGYGYYGYPAYYDYGPGPYAYYGGGPYYYRHRHWRHHHYW